MPISESAIQRSVIIHHDDLGASHSANVAFVELCDLGVVTCGSVMVPGPWFPEIVDIAKQRPDLDIGVHLTLNAEFSNFRWRPLTNAPSLIDAEGFFWRTIAEARSATREEVRAELRCQIDTAMDSGIDVTHLDSHMGTIWQPEFVDIYLDLGSEYRLPIVLPDDLQQLSAPHIAPVDILAKSHSNGNPRFRRFLTTPFGNLSPDIETYREILAAAAPGLNWCGFHFAAPGDIQLITEDAPTRIAEYRVFQSGAVQSLLDEMGFEPVGMKALRDALR